jgi:hypothetical protein
MFHRDRLLDAYISAKVVIALIAIAQAFMDAVTVMGGYFNSIGSDPLTPSSKWEIV